MHMLQMVILKVHFFHKVPVTDDVAASTVLDSRISYSQKNTAKKKFPLNSVTDAMNQAGQGWRVSSTSIAWYIIWSLLS